MGEKVEFDSIVAAIGENLDAVTAVGRVRS
jgi:hypothetical protein